MSMEAARHPGTAHLNDVRHDPIGNFGKRLLMAVNERRDPLSASLICTVSSQAGQSADFAASTASMPLRLIQRVTRQAIPS